MCSTARVTSSASLSCGAMPTEGLSGAICGDSFSRSSVLTYSAVARVSKVCRHKRILDALASSPQPVIPWNYSSSVGSAARCLARACQSGATDVRLTEATSPPRRSSALLLRRARPRLAQPAGAPVRRPAAQSWPDRRGRPRPRPRHAGQRPASASRALGFAILHARMRDLLDGHPAHLPVLNDAGQRRRAAKAGTARALKTWHSFSGAPELPHLAAPMAEQTSPHQPVSPR